MRRRFGPLLAAAVAATLCLGAPRAAQAVVFDFLMDMMGKGAPRVPSDRSGDKPRKIIFNGLPLEVTTGRVQKSVTEVLDYYQQRYPGGALQEFTKGPAVTRREGPDSGSLISIEVPDKATAEQVLKGDRALMTAGPLRLVFARRAGGQTDYLIATSDKPMSESLFQTVQSADAPGQDPAGVPRPSGVRTFSFVEPQAGYQIAMYEVTQPASAALQAAAGRMAGAGWDEDPQFGEAARKRQQLVARFTRGKRDLVVTARTTRDDSAITQLSYLMRDL